VDLAVVVLAISSFRPSAATSGEVGSVTSYLTSVGEISHSLSRRLRTSSYGNGVLETSDTALRNYGHLSNSSVNELLCTHTERSSNPLERLQAAGRPPFPTVTSPQCSPKSLTSPYMQHPGEQHQQIGHPDRRGVPGTQRKHPEGLTWGQFHRR
jgi:hypothetical protein